MCLAVYLASEKAIAPIEWDEHNRSVSITPIRKHDLGVKDKLAYPNVYYVGSHLGCGCGFAKEGIEAEELEKAQEDYRVLATIIREAMQEAAVELFVCWEGDQCQPPEASEKITVDELTSSGFEFQELVHYRVVG